MSYKTALSFMEYMKNETDVEALSAAIYHMEQIHKTLENTPAYEGFKVRQPEARRERCSSWNDSKAF